MPVYLLDRLVEISVRRLVEISVRRRFVTFLKYLCGWFALAVVINVIYDNLYPIIQPYTNYNLPHPIDDERTTERASCYISALGLFHKQIWWLVVQIVTMVPYGIRQASQTVRQMTEERRTRDWTQWELLWNCLILVECLFMLRVFWVAWEGMSWTPPTLSQFLRKLWITASITAGILIVGAVVVKVLSLLARLRESKRAAAAEAAAADLFADNARPGLRRRAHRGRRRGRARETAADEPSATESKPEPPVAPESKTEEPPAAPEAKREEEESPAATGPPPGKKILVDDDILDDAAAHARTLETSLTAHQAEVQRLKKILKEQQREIPDAYLCPITMDPMEDPCIAADGHSYERRAITDWFARGNNTSPKTGAQLDDTRLFPNHALKSAIQDFLEEVRRFDAATEVATAGARD